MNAKLTLGLVAAICGGVFVVVGLSVMLLGWGLLVLAVVATVWLRSHQAALEGQRTVPHCRDAVPGFLDQLASARAVWSGVVPAEPSPSKLRKIRFALWRGPLPSAVNVW
jgi:hypothetical protein